MTPGARRNGSFSSGAGLGVPPLLLPGDEPLHRFRQPTSCFSELLQRQIGSRDVWFLDIDAEPVILIVRPAQLLEIWISSGFRDPTFPHPTSLPGQEPSERAATA